MQVLFCYEVFKSTFKHVESSALAQTLKFNINPHYRPRQSWPVTVATQCMLQAYRQDMESLVSLDFLRGEE